MTMAGIVLRHRSMHPPLYVGAGGSLVGSQADALTFRDMPSLVEFWEAMGEFKHLYEPSPRLEVLR